MNSSLTTSSKLIPFFCLFVSGAASLVYELIWIRQLALVFGGTLYAISAVLCSFMSGLALGAWAISLFIDSRNRKNKKVNSILLYGIIEGVIGLYALLFPYGLELLAEGYSPLVTGSIKIGSWLHLIEFGLATILMLPATICMGATLPLIGSWSIGKNKEKIIPNVSILYSLNTFGAVVGCLYTQTVGVKFFGVSGTNLTAVLMNTLVFLLCALSKNLSINDRSKNIRTTISKNDLTLPSRELSLLLLLIFMYSGMASLSSQILWTRVLLFPMGTTLNSFTLILATFLFGIAFGSLIADRLLGHSYHILKFLLIQVLIAVSCITILPMFENLHEWTAQADRLFYDLDNMALKTIGIRSLFAFGLMFLPTLGFGLVFPLANQININLF
ncbi:uncharacterized protein METZ01_LOCUS103621, partial [marine metagenome]